MQRTASAALNSARIFARLLLNNRRGTDRIQRALCAELLAANARISNGSEAPLDALQHALLLREVDSIMGRYYGRYRGDTNAIMYVHVAREGKRGWRAAFTEQLEILGLTEKT